MAIAKAPRGVKLLSQTSSVPLLRLFSTAPVQNAPPTSFRRSNPGGKEPKAAKMFVPPPIQRFVMPGGKLYSTLDIYDFLKREKIETFSGNMKRIYIDATVAADFTVKLEYSPAHIMHIHHLQYLDPRGHPVVEAIKYKYKTKKKEEPLWVYMISKNGHVGLVKSLGHRRLTAAFWRAMAELGHDRWKSPDDTSVKGTLMITIHDTLKASNQPADVFGKAAAQAVVDWCESYTKSGTGRGASHVRSNPGSERERQGRSPSYFKGDRGRERNDPYEKNRHYENRPEQRYRGDDRRRGT